MFLTSYSELLTEINRRHAVSRRHQEIVDSYRKELSLLYKGKLKIIIIIFFFFLNIFFSNTGETQRRETFFESYGRFLPQSLVPTLSEPITRFQIFPEKVVNNLPILDAEQQQFQQQQQQRNTTNSNSVSSTSNSSSLTPQSQRQATLHSSPTQPLQQQQKSNQK